MAANSAAPRRLQEEMFIDSLESGSFPAERFDHREHLRYAWLLLGRTPLAQALPRVDAALLRFATQNGAPEKYHQTVTWTYVLVIHELMNSSGNSERSEEPTSSFDVFLDRHPVLIEPVPRFMSRFYAPTTWQSARAARTYLLPDRVRRDLAA